MWTSLTTFLGIATLSVSKAVLITGMIVFVLFIYLLACSNAIGFSDLVDLWVIKIKKPMILCVRGVQIT